MSLFQPNLFTSHSNENFEYITLYYFTWSTKCVFFKNKNKSLVIPVTFPGKQN